MATNHPNGPMFRDQFYCFDNLPIEEQDVSSAIAASLNNPVYATSDLQKAILNSLDETNKTEMELDQHQAQDVTGSLVKTEESNLEEKHDKDTKVGKITKPETLESRIREIDQMRSLELPLLYDSSGDTFAFIDPPDQQPEQDDESYERCTARYKTPMRLKKDVLMKYGASYFEKIFEAKNQDCIPRRRNFVGKLPQHVKYFVDLTPPTDGDQAAYLTTELCCSDGVRKWYQSTKRWMVSKVLVGGQDEYMVSRKAAFAIPEQGLESDPFAPDLQSPPVPLEYSPVRHRSAIERVLLALHGDDPQLDSAPKVWTTFAVAKHFGITESPLTDYIVRWLRASPNSYFLEVLPETALRIADGLQCQELCRDTFAILVGEEALGAAYRSRVSDFDSSLSVHGRKKEPLPEGLKTAVEYASKALSERVNTEFTNLVDDGMHWIGNLPEFQKLPTLGSVPENLGRNLTKLIDLLRAYVRGAVYAVLCMNFSYSPYHATGIPGDDLFPRTSWEEIWAKLVPRERILARSFWSVLQRCDLLRGPTNLHVQLQLADGSTVDTHGDAQRAIFQDLTFDKILDEDVESLILSVKDQYFKYCDTLAKEPSSISKSNTKIGATSSSTPATHWFPFRTWLNTGSGYGSTEKLLSTNKDSDVVSEMSLYPSTDEKDGVGCDMAVHNGSSVLDGKKLDSLPPAFKRPEITYDRANFFHFGTFCFQAKTHLKTLSSRMMDAPDNSIRREGLEVELTRTLVCLTNSEWKYLPMWAGGNDDGSGGVFNDDVPFSHEGFSTAGPKVIMENHYSGDDNSTERSFSVISRSGTSHPHTSLLNNNGFSDVLPRGIAVSIDGESWASSHTFDSYNVVATVPHANGADEKARKVSVGLENMEIDDSKAAQDENPGVKSAKFEEGFDDIFAYSTDDEDDDDGDTVHGDDQSEVDMNEDET